MSGVVVGYDSSEPSAAAVRWAAAEARLRGAPLTVVHAWDLFPAVGPYTVPADDLRAGAEHIVAEGAALAREETGDVHALVGQGGPVTVLMDAAADADLLVLGSRGRGGFAGLVLGSTAAALASHAPVPVAVVRDAPNEGPVVVGVDGSPASLEALGLAFAEADLRGADVVALAAWPQDVRVDPAPLVDAASLREYAAERLARLAAPWSEKYPGVRVRTAVLDGEPREVLLDAAVDAGLLVVGSRGLGGFRSLLLGSVGQALLHHAPSPVLVARAPRGEE